jgi:hypothetical protein
VTSTPAGIDCGATCVKSFDTGTVVTLLPAPGATYVFGGWSGDATARMASSRWMPTRPASRPSTRSPT